MKRFFRTLVVIAAIAMFAAPINANASNKLLQFGVKAGLNFTNMTDMGDFGKDFLKTYTGFNAGVLLKINLPLGFEVQPELLYVQAGSNYHNEGIMGVGATDIKFYDGSLRLPVNIQWGIDILGIVKPYVLVSPFVGYTLFQNAQVWNNITSTTEVTSMDPARFQYGIGVGAGVNIWKFQVSFKWNWNLNSFIAEDTNMSDILEVLEKDNIKYNGGELSIAFIF